MSDTPAPVAEKMKNLPIILAMFNHYLAENHDGDYVDCVLCVTPGDTNE